MTGPAPALTLLVPCFNEGAHVDRFAAAAAAWAARHPGLALEFLFVDDGSTDDTRARLERVSRQLPGGRVLALDANVGKGGALQAGVAHARGETVLFLDADLAVDLSHVERALELRDQGADVVVGCRNIPGASIERRQRWPRRWLGRVYRRMARFWLGLRVADVTCGFKAFRRDVARELFARAHAPRWGFDAEILFLAERAGCDVRQMPVRWYDGEVSAVRLRRDVWGALRELAGVRWRHRRSRRELPLPTTPQPSHVPAGTLRE
ncbi:MAG: glycosyltransferase [Planctomycetota bacterium]|nr:glycosyltransferase [Planctomycetota bacterium]